MYRVEPPASAPISALPGRLETRSSFPGLAWGLRSAPGGGPHRRSVCVHLSPDHTHDLLLDFGVLSVDIGISHLAVFVPGRGEGGGKGVSRGCPMGAGEVGAAGTHTKKKRVQTWSETGQTQMLPCFCRSLEVMTAGGGGCRTGDGGPRWAQPVVGTLPPSLLCPPGEPGMWVLPGPPSPSPPTRPRTFAKRDAVQVAALEETGLDGAGLRGEQPALLARPGSAHPVPCTRGGRVPIPILPRCPPARHLGDGVHPVVPLHQLILRRHPVLPFPHPCGEARRWPSLLGTEHPWCDAGTHATDGDSHAGCSHPAAKPWEPPKSGRSGFRSLENVGVLIPWCIGKPQSGWEEASAVRKDAGRCSLPRSSSGRHDAEHPRGPCREWGWERRQDRAAQAASYLSIQRKYWRWGSDRCPCHRLLHAACRKTPG